MLHFIVIKYCAKRYLVREPLEETDLVEVPADERIDELLAERTADGLDVERDALTLVERTAALLCIVFACEDVTVRVGDATRVAAEVLATRVAAEVLATRVAVEVLATRVAAEVLATRVAVEVLATRVAAEVLATRVVEVLAERTFVLPNVRFIVAVERVAVGATATRVRALVTLAVARTARLFCSKLRALLIFCEALRVAKERSGWIVA